MKSLSFNLKLLFLIFHEKKMAHLSLAYLSDSKLKIFHEETLLFLNWKKVLLSISLMIFQKGFRIDFKLIKFQTFTFCWT